jgi:hypothetical protein
MLRVTRMADRAIDIYLDEYFPIEDVIQRTAAEFARDGGFPPAMTRTAGWYLRVLFRRHVLERTDLLASLCRLLKGRARDTGYAVRGEKWRREQRSEDNCSEDGADNTAEDAAFHRAEKVLGLTGATITRGHIRERYKSLIRKYHPDVNPNGLEMSKRLNASYALLLERFKE